MGDGTALVDVASDPAVLTIGDRTYTLRKMRLGDYARAQRYIKDKRINHYLETTRMIPLPAEERAKTLAEIECCPIALTDIWKEFEGEVYLLWAAIKDSDPAITLEWVMNEMPPLDREAVNTILFYVCGVAKPTAEGLGGPFADTTSTSPK